MESTRQKKVARQIQKDVAERRKEEEDTLSREGQQLIDLIPTYDLKCNPTTTPSQN